MLAGMTGEGSTKEAGWAPSLGRLPEGSNLFQSLPALSRGSLFLNIVKNELRVFKNRYGL